MKRLLYRRNYGNIEAMGMKELAPPTPRSTGYYYPIALEMLEALEKAGVLEPVEPERRYVQVGSTHGEPDMEDMLIIIVDDWPYRPKGKP
jgi:hypothetical protein